MSNKQRRAFDLLRQMEEADLGGMDFESFETGAAFAELRDREDTARSAGFVACTRCGAACRIGPQPNERARLLKRATEAAGGLCVNCAATRFLKTVVRAQDLLRGNCPGAFLTPHVQAHFAQVMRAGFADAAPDELNWGWIVDFWDYP